MFLWASLVIQMVKNLLAMQETQVQSLGQGRSPGEGTDYPFQDSCLENCMNRGTWWATFLGVTESDTPERLTLKAYQTFTWTRLERFIWMES